MVVGERNWNLGRLAFPPFHTFKKYIEYTGIIKSIEFYILGYFTVLNPLDAKGTAASTDRMTFRILSFFKDIFVQ